MVHLRIPILLILLMFIISPAHSQNEKMDSLQIQNVISARDTNSVNLLISLSKSKLGVSFDDALSYAMEAKDIAISIDFRKGEALALKYIGMPYYFQSKFIETLDYWQQSLEVFEELGDIKGVANMYSNIGAIYLNQGNDTKAIEVLLKALPAAEEIGDSLRIATVLNNLGGVYFSKEATQDKSLNYYLRAYEISLKLDNKEAIGTSAVNAGRFYMDIHKADSALFYFNIALDAFAQEETGNVSYVLMSIGETYALNKDFSQSKKYLTDALKLARSSQSSMDITRALFALGGIEKEMRNYNTAISYYKQAEVYAKEVDLIYELSHTYEALALSYAEISNYAKAYHYEKLFLDIKDTIYNVQTDRDIGLLQFNYDLDKKQSEVDILTKDKALQDAEFRRQKLVKNTFLGGLVLIFIIAFIIYRSYRSKVKINIILDKQKVEIEELVLNILPAEVADELKFSGVATPRYYEKVSVLFTDFKGFSKIAESLSPTQLVSELNEFFVAFDHITDEYNLEKIKTIGDAYMCAGGIPKENDNHPLDAVRAGLAMQEFMKTNNEKRIKNGKIPWELRAGIHTGSVVAGVVGEKKFAYDIWGSTVNISSRMESNGEAGKLNISASTYELIKKEYNCSYRGKIYAKNIGDIDMYFVEDEILLAGNQENLILQNVQTKI